jgi:hypothetical protein
MKRTVVQMALPLHEFILDFKENKLVYQNNQIGINTHTVSKPQLVCASARIQIEPNSWYIYEHRLSSPT